MEKLHTFAIYFPSGTSQRGFMVPSMGRKQSSKLIQECVLGRDGGSGTGEGPRIFLFLCFFIDTVCDNGAIFFFRHKEIL
jgi:hypothetical protein